MAEWDGEWLQKEAKNNLSVATPHPTPPYRRSRKRPHHDQER